jgi:beta-galactosidase
VTKAIWRGTNAMDSWSWKNCAGNKAEIEVYADAHAVELFLNGKSFGKKKVKDFAATYQTKYASGMLKAVAYDPNGRVLSESELVSATGKTRIALRPEETAIKPGELVYINIDLVGENGVVESNDDRKLTISIEAGKLLGFGSVNPCTEERFDSGSYTTFYGKALAVVQAMEVGSLIIRVSGERLEPAEAKISVKA